MTETVYCEHADLRKHGLPPGVLAQQALPVASVSTTGDTLTIADHACAADDPVVLTVDLGSTLPSPLVAGTTYYARPVAGRSDLLQLSATAGGAAVNLTTVGSGTFALLADISEARSYEARRYASRQIDSHMPGEDVPFAAPYPAQAIAYCAKLAARELLRTLGRHDDGVWEMADGALADLVKFLRYGMSLRGATTGSAPSTARWGADARNWGGLP